MLFFYLIGGFVTLWTTFSIIICIVFGIKEREHFVFVAALILSFSSLVLLVRWYFDSDLEPKFRILIALFVFTVLVIGISANVYVWKEKDETPKTTIKCDGLYRTSDGYCFPKHQIDSCNSPAVCLQFIGRLANCVPTCPDSTTGSSTGASTTSFYSRPEEGGNGFLP